MILRWSQKMGVLWKLKIHCTYVKYVLGLSIRCFTFSLSSLFFQPADEYEFSGIVYSHHMSPVATTHCLVAVGCHSSTLKLVDLKSGSATHMLKGHKKSILTVRWSPKNEYLLVSGRFVEISSFRSNVLLLTVTYPVGAWVALWTSFSVLFVVLPHTDIALVSTRKIFHCFKFVSTKLCLKIHVHKRSVLKLCCVFSHWHIQVFGAKIK